MARCYESSRAALHLGNTIFDLRLESAPHFAVKRYQRYVGRAKRSANGPVLAVSVLEQLDRTPEMAGVYLAVLVGISGIAAAMGLLPVNAFLSAREAGTCAAGLFSLTN